MTAKKIQDIPIRSLGQFISNVEETSGNALRLFRGQNTDQCLLPRIMRLAKANEISRAKIDDVERKMLERFRKECSYVVCNKAIGSVGTDVDRRTQRDADAVTRLDSEPTCRTVVRGCH